MNEMEYDSDRFSNCIKNTFGEYLKPNVRPGLNDKYQKNYINVPTTIGIILFTIGFNKRIQIEL